MQQRDQVLLHRLRVVAVRLEQLHDRALDGRVAPHARGALFRGLRGRRDPVRDPVQVVHRAPREEHVGQREHGPVERDRVLGVRAGRREDRARDGRASPRSRGAFSAYFPNALAASEPFRRHHDPARGAMPRSRYTSASPAPIDMRAELRTTAHVPKHDCQAPRGSRGTVRAVHGPRDRVADGHEGFDGRWRAPRAAAAKRPWHARAPHIRSLSNGRATRKHD